MILHFMRSFSIPVLLIALLAVQLVHAAVPFDDAQGKHLVFAHYMPCFPVLRGDNPGDSYGYQSEFDPAKETTRANRSSKPVYYPTVTGADVGLQMTIAEIRLAKQAGIDGFMVDLLWDQDSYLNQWKTLLRAAEIVGDFKIGLMPDYATLGGPSDKPKQQGAALSSDMILHWLQVAKDSPALLRYAGKPVVAPYGAGYPDANGAAENDKKYLFDYLAAHGMPISYMPTHGLDWPLYEKDYAKEWTSYAIGTGSFTPSSGADVRERALKYWPKNYLQMGENSFMYYNRAWNYSAPRLSTKYRDMWLWNIKHRDQVKWVQLITWNDFGESALSPDNNHFMTWLPVTRYYAEWFKTGKRPVIKQDFLAIFHRQHPYYVTPTTYGYRCPSNIPTDEVEALAFLTAPATLVINTGGREVRQEVGAGVQSLICGFLVGVQKARIERKGVMVCSVTSPIPIHDKPIRENLWLIAADSAHLPRSLATDSWSDINGKWSGAKSTREGTGVTITGDPKTWSDYTVFATITPTFTADGQQVGLIGRCLSSGVAGDRRYQFTISLLAGKGMWQITRNDAGTLTVLESGPFNYEAGKSVRLRFTCVGEHLIGFINDQLISANGYDYQLPFGSAGIIADGASVKCSDFSVQSFDPDLFALK